MRNTGYIWQGDTLQLHVYLQPRASRDEIVGPHGDNLKIRITAPPVDGKANQHLLRFLAREFRVPLSQVALLSGQASRTKLVQIQQPRQLPPMIRPAE
ncbi:MAG: DUF167 family protein [Proteobacteria bacterium]|nr:DUF167 family protein [Pseudomonadota bacterium]MCG6934659.1 DUF167 family protein [Pseudomonadota bacterium]